MMIRNLHLERMINAFTYSHVKGKTGNLKAKDHSRNILHILLTSIFLKMEILCIVIVELMNYYSGI